LKDADTMKAAIRSSLRWLPWFVGRIPVPIHVKLFAAFLAIAVLLISLGLVGLQVLASANERAEELGILEQKVAAYRQLQNSITLQLFHSASAFSASGAVALDDTSRQIRQSGYDFDRLKYVTRDEGAILNRIEADYSRFIATVLRVVELVQQGRVEDAQALHLGEARNLADSLLRLTNELVNRTEAAVVKTIDDNQDDYVTSRWAVVTFASGSITLALGLGYGIAFSIIGPIKGMDWRLRQVAAGDFSGHVSVANRDELGALAANVNQMNDELGRLYRDLRAANRHKSEFLANMSHELRTPLNAIIGFSEVLSERIFGELNEKQDEYIRDILSSGTHLLSLINDVLDLSKVEAGRMDLDSGPLSLVEALQNALSMVREQAARRGVNVSLEIAPELDLVEADERKLKQVVFNLLSNAVKFTPSGGNVFVVACASSGQLTVLVRDTGIGIAPEDQERVFEEFQQADRVYGTEQQGTGLGLAIAKRFVELHGGRIWVDSLPGQGSMFTFTLPEAVPPRIDRHNPSAAGQQPLEPSSAGHE
jgi:signal transduction histidine kinase